MVSRGFEVPHKHRTLFLEIELASAGVCEKAINFGG